MRLIDADELKKKIRHWNYNATTSTPTFDFVTDEDIDECPTVCDIDAIRAEFIKKRDSDDWFHPEDSFIWQEAIEIIDKYTKRDKE
jgi:hypothetical protein